MKEKPIIFSGEMVRAILEGRKTMTRRVIDGEFTEGPHTWVKWVSKRYKVDLSWSSPKGMILGELMPRAPYQVGDRLYVKEQWRVGSWQFKEHDPFALLSPSGMQIAVDYRASPELNRTPWIDVPEKVAKRLNTQSIEDCKKAVEKGIGSVREGGEGYVWDRGDSPCRWRSARFMPRAFSRLTLEVVGVRVERLREITNDDAKAEGIQHTGWNNEAENFAELWEKINGKRAPWASNPWVWVIEFKKQAP